MLNVCVLFAGSGCGCGGGDGEGVVAQDRSAQEPAPRHWPADGVVSPQPEGHLAHSIHVSPSRSFIQACMHTCTSMLHPSSCLYIRAPIPKLANA